MRLDEIQGKFIRYYIILSAVLFYVYMSFLFASVILLIYPFVKTFISLFEFLSTPDNIFTIQNIVLHVAPLIELTLFNIIIFILASGIYAYILTPIFEKDRKNMFSLKIMFKDFVANLSSPFLLLIASILVLSAFEKIVEVYIYVHEHGALIQENPSSYLYYNLIIIIFIFITILSIAVLLWIEKMVLHPTESQE